jgi:lysophospholipase L1-like esterase
VITNPGAIRVLCFGDSNTYGLRANRADREAGHYRWPSDVRWTGRLQALLGPDYEIIEEGRSGRTVEMPDPLVAGADGRAYFAPCLNTHNPLDVVLIMLGTNDVKWHFGRSTEDIVESIGRLVDDVETHGLAPDGRTPAVLLVAPVPVERRSATGEFDDESVRKSHELGPALRKLAEARGAGFADAGTVGAVGEDGIHLSEETHERLAALLAEALGSLDADA